MRRNKVRACGTEKKGLEGRAVGGAGGDKNGVRNKEEDILLSLRIWITTATYTADIHTRRKGI